MEKQQIRVEENGLKVIFEIRNGITELKQFSVFGQPPASPPRDPTKRYDEEGRELNAAGYPIIDFGLSKAGNDF